MHVVRGIIGVMFDIKEDVYPLIPPTGKPVGEPQPTPRFDQIAWLYTNVIIRPEGVCVCVGCKGTTCGGCWNGDQKSLWSHRTCIHLLVTFRDTFRVFAEVERVFAEVILCYICYTIFQLFISSIFAKVEHQLIKSQPSNKSTFQLDCQTQNHHHAFTWKTKKQQKTPLILPPKTNEMFPWKKHYY